MQRDYPLVIGLTGGIASGKSTAAQLFADLGVVIIDADQISREIVTPGSELLQKIISHFGEKYLDSAGNLIRPSLREHIFKYPEDRKWLNQLLHPVIYTRMKAKLNKLYLPYAKQNIPYIICVIPLLIETGKPDFIDRILAIDIDESTQLRRLIKRDSLTLEEAQNSLKSQASPEMRLDSADDVIHNTDDMNSLKKQVLRLDQQYKSS